MRNLAVFIFIILLTAASFAQKPKTNFENQNKSNSIVKDEKEEFRTAVNQVEPAKRIAALKTFLKTFPDTKEKYRAMSLITSGRAELADSKLKAGETEEGVRLFKLAVAEAPTPIDEKLFAGIILRIPSNLFWRGQRREALEVAEIIEQKLADDPTRLLGLATFHIGIENAADAIRIGKKVVAVNPTARLAYQTLGLAYRLNFDLENSTKAYAKALELDPQSVTAIRNLAEMKRATGDVSGAIKLYEEILNKNVSSYQNAEEKSLSDLNARTGLILTLFDAGKVVEAELQLNQFLKANPNNMTLLGGAAYWYAAKNDGDKAIELAQKALEIEPRYTWGYIALARGLIKKGDPLAAERTLLSAQQYGNFPTLQYEIAAARLAAGFYKDAIDELQANFILENGRLKTNLGGRLERTADNFTELLSLERQASIFEPLSADSANEAEKLKKLLKFAQKLEAKDSTESEIIAAADEFISGGDKMKTHRQIFVANQLLDNKKALPKVLEITKEATKGVDAALEVESPSAAVLADELYESRQIAFKRGAAIIVPQIPRQTLASIIRGRIEEISGWALFRQNETNEASVRLKRAISILPKGSSYLRSTMWRMGTVLEVQGKAEEALDRYIAGYSPEEGDEVKKLVIESLYKKINGSLDGLQERLEAAPQEKNTADLFVGQAKMEDKKPSEDKPKKDKIPDVVPIARNSVTGEIAELPEDLNLNPNNSKPSKKVISTPAVKETNVNPVGQSNPADRVKMTPIGENSPTEASSANPATNSKTPENKVRTADAIITNDTRRNDPKTKSSKMISETATVSENKPPPVNEIKPNDTNQAIKPKVAAPKAVKPQKKVTETVTKTVETADRTPEKTSVIGTVGKVSNVEISDEAEKKAEQTTAVENLSETQVKTKGYKKPSVTLEDTFLKTKTELNVAKQNPLEKKGLDESADKPSDAAATAPKVADANTIAENNSEISEKPAATRRQFVVVTENTNSAGEIKPCEIVTDQEVVSIINNGGILGVVAGTADRSKNVKLKAFSNSPKDLKVEYDAEISVASERSFFIIKSISKKQGDFRVTFEAVCGTKDILVKVR